MAEKTKEKQKENVLDSVPHVEKNAPSEFKRPHPDFKPKENESPKQKEPAPQPKEEGFWHSVGDWFKRAGHAIKEGFQWVFAHARWERNELEEQYREFAKGHEKPKDVVTPETARQFSKKYYGAYVESAKPKDIPKEYPAPSQDEYYRGLDEAVQNANSTAFRLLTEDESYLGPELKRRFENTPSVARLESGEVLISMHPDLSLEDIRGLYGTWMRDSNYIMMNESANSEDMGRLVPRLIHENNHYLCWLGGGEVIRWKEDSGLVAIGYVSWFLEGATELLAVQLSLEKGYYPPGVAYQQEIMVCSFIQQLVGKEEFRKAYFSGDYTKVRSIVDGKLGEGTFRKIMGKENWGEALDLIEASLNKSGFVIGKDIYYGMPEYSEASKKRRLSQE